MEPMSGIEPPTQALRKPCSTIEPHRHMDNSINYTNFLITVNINPHKKCLDKTAMYVKLNDNNHAFNRSRDIRNVNRKADS